MSVSRKILLLLALAPMAIGCVEMSPTRSGFLTDYAGLREIKHHHRVRVKPVDPQELAEIDSFYIEPVEWLADDMGQPAGSPKHAERIRHALETQLACRLEEILPVVDLEEIGPRTAIVRSAVTGVQESKPLINLLLITQVGPIFNGGASAEIEIIGPSGHQVIAESVAYTGHEWELLGFFRKDEHSVSAMRRATKRLVRELQADTSEEAD
jgi:hypothetical protein